MYFCGFKFIQSSNFNQTAKATPKTCINYRQDIARHFPLEITPYSKAGDCGWMVYVGGMTEEQLEELEHGQEIVVR